MTGWLAAMVTIAIAARQAGKALHVFQIERRERRVEGATPGNPVHHQQERIEFAETPELRHGAGGARIAAGSNGHAGREGQRVPQRRRPASSKIGASNHLDGGGDIVRLLGDSSRDGLDWGKRIRSLGPLRGDLGGSDPEQGGDGKRTQHHGRLLQSEFEAYMNSS